MVLSSKVSVPSPASLFSQDFSKDYVPLYSLGNFFFLSLLQCFLLPFLNIPFVNAKFCVDLHLNSDCVFSILMIITCDVRDQHKIVIISAFQFFFVSYLHQIQK